VKLKEEAKAVIEEEEMMKLIAKEIELMKQQLEKEEDQAEKKRREEEKMKLMAKEIELMEQQLEKEEDQAEKKRREEEKMKLMAKEIKLMEQQLEKEEDQAEKKRREEEQQKVIQPPKQPEGPGTDWIKYGKFHITDKVNNSVFFCLLQSLKNMTMKLDISY
jgi:hypothetical protein